MAKRRILHMVTPARNVSAFDANMAVDAGYEVIIPHTEMSASDVSELVQDAIFSRTPKSAASTGLFIGGYDVNQAADMLQSARESKVPPFEISIFADPNGAYTTSAALIALIEHHLKEKHSESLKDRKLKIFGGGPVGLCASILATDHGAQTELVRLTSSARTETVSEFIARYNQNIPSVSATSSSERAEVVSDAEVIICTAKAGIQVLDKSILEHAGRLIIAADVNAVPPSGIEGVGVMDNGTQVNMPWGNFLSIGALGIGGVKYKVQHQLFKKMLESEDAITIDFLEAYSEAVQHVR